MCLNNKEDVTAESTARKRIFVVAWDFPPKMSGESVVCKRALEHSIFRFDVCSGCFDGVLPQMDNVTVHPRKGSYISWPFRAVRLFRTLDKLYNYHIMQSRVMPPQGHFAGLLIKMMKPSIKWVAYFSDPIWNSPFIKFSSLFRDDGLHRPNYLLMKVFGIPAWVAVCWADLLVFNNERLAKFILGKHYNKYKHKIEIVPYGHDGVVQTNTAPIKREDQSVVVSHVGQVYGDRSYRYVVEALEMLSQQRPEFYQRLQLHQVGFICKQEHDFIVQSKVADRFTFIDSVNYEESLGQMEQSDYCLILDPYFDKPRKNMYVPVKIFDYMSMGKPILAVADLDSATADIARELKCAIASHQAEEIARMFLECAEGTMSMNIDSNNHFHCKSGIEMLDKRLAAI